MSSTRKIDANSLDFEHHRKQTVTVVTKDGQQVEKTIVSDGNKLKKKARYYGKGPRVSRKYRLKDIIKLQYKGALILERVEKLILSEPEMVWNCIIRKYGRIYLEDDAYLLLVKYIAQYRPHLIDEKIKMSKKCRDKINRILEQQKLLPNAV